jgi:hypothetical protein
MLDIPTVHMVYCRMRLKGSGVVLQERTVSVQG